MLRAAERSLLRRESDLDQAFGVLEGVGGLVFLAELLQRDAEVVPSLGVFGREFDFALKIAARLLVFALVGGEQAEIVPGSGISGRSSVARR